VDVTKISSQWGPWFAWIPLSLTFRII